MEAQTNNRSVNKFENKFVRQVNGDFPDSIIITDGGKHIKAFIRQSYISLLERVKDGFPIEKDERVTTPRGSLALEAILNSRWNDCRAEILSTLSKSLEEIKKKTWKLH